MVHRGVMEAFQAEGHRFETGRPLFDKMRPRRWLWRGFLVYAGSQLQRGVSSGDKGPSNRQSCRVVSVPIFDGFGPVPDLAEVTIDSAH